MLENTTGKYNATGDEVRADSWWGYTDGLHTVQINYSNFKGKFRLQGTLSVNPEETDWFDINLTDGIVTGPEAVFDYETGVAAYTFIGNFVFLRAKLERDDPVQTDPAIIESLGTIDKVLLSM